jgi:SAM-dependent methyltransferase
VAETPWAVDLFGKSVLKKRKLRELVESLGPSEGLRCLDLGSDNGVISLLLRQRGGSWASADLTDEAVASIRGLVGSDVHKLEGTALPFPDAEFDRVVVVDMLEHVPDEAAFVRELARILKPGGRLIVNTPHLKQTLLRRLRHAVGQTDEKHGHLRAGYTVEGLRTLLGPNFAILIHRTYSRFFSELADAAINWGIERLGKKGSAKGMVVTGGDVKKHATLFRAYSLVYPFVASVAALDALIPWVSGYMLIASAERLNRATVSHGFPTADIDQMLAEIERGYLEMPR